MNAVDRALAFVGLGERAPEQPPRRLSLALQGGGSFGAFAWGVLDRLLEQREIAFDAISGSSAGAVNAEAAPPAHRQDFRPGRIRRARGRERGKPRLGVSAALARRRPRRRGSLARRGGAAGEPRGGRGDRGGVSGNRAGCAP